jgi:HD-like signal output (HDOD) protein
MVQGTLMNRLESLQHIAAQSQSADIVFPSSVAIAVKIRRHIDDPDIHLAATADLVKIEPMLAARVVAIANSVAYRRSDTDITDVGNAVSRIGLRMVRTLVQALIVRQLAGAPKDARTQKMAMQLWEHTAHVAAISRLIARRVTHLDPETALFTALVHDAGHFYLLSRAAEFPALLDEEPVEGEDELMLQIHRKIAHQLDLPDTVLAALEVVWQGYVTSDPVSLGDTVALAKELAPEDSPMVRLSSGEEIAPIDLAVGEEHLAQILQDAAEEVASLTRALAT